MESRECQSGGCPTRLKRFNNTSTNTADLEGSVLCRWGFGRGVSRWGLPLAAESYCGKDVVMPKDREILSCNIVRPQLC
jgi:hypothetical protein